MAEEISIYSNRCWINNALIPATITYIHGKIIAVDKIKLPAAIDFGDDVIMPGVIDAHVHVNEPGRTEWEGFHTATISAAAGGITTIIDMPLNATPVTTTVDALKKKMKSSENQLHVNCGFYGGLIPNHKNELELLLKEGILGVKCFLLHSGIDEFPNVTYEDIKDVMPSIAAASVPLLAHCELETVAPASVFENHSDYRQYLASRPKQWENDAVNLMIGIAEEFDAAIHIVHVSSAETLPAIQSAKNKGLKLTAETCPQYIYFSSEEIPDHNTLYKCAPPIREKINNDQLKTALKNGILDFIASDHSPAPPEIKLTDTGDLKNAWGGIAGLQFLLPASWSAMKDTMTIEEFIPLLTAHPAKFLDVTHKKGKIELGLDADFVIWSPEEKYVVEEKDILHRHTQSPYVGKEMYGKIKTTIVNGTIVFTENKIIQKNAGKWLLRQ